MTDLRAFVDQWLTQLESMLSHAEVRALSPIVTVLEAGAGYTLFSLLGGVAADPTVPLESVKLNREEVLDRLIALRMRAIVVAQVGFDRLLDAAFERRAREQAQSTAGAPR